MSEHSTPHFHNQPGVGVIRVNAKEFMCIGALPPLDHPHVYIDMGSENEAVCPYCATRYVYDPTLTVEADPLECVFHEAEPLAHAP
jgi:uncharacterized Zn-finger protein